MVRLESSPPCLLVLRDQLSPHSSPFKQLSGSPNHTAGCPTEQSKLAWQRWQVKTDCPTPAQPRSFTIFPPSGDPLLSNTFTETSSHWPQGPVGLPGPPGPMGKLSLGPVPGVGLGNGIVLCFSPEDILSYSRSPWTSWSHGHPWESWTHGE